MVQNQPESKQVTLDTLTIEQLKSIAYDMIVQSQKIQQDLVAVESVIQKKYQEINSKEITKKESKIPVAEVVEPERVASN